jgi:YidC/Oxa1 family membrane protein insertase
MMMPSNVDPQARAQQRLFLILPLFSLLYGHILPAGLFIYWIVTTLFSIGQQYLIAGWGSLFPLFGWTPAFARDHTPRFPVPAVTVRKQDNGEDEPPSRRRTPTDRAAGTVRPARTRGRSNRRGRRR